MSFKFDRLIKYYDYYANELSGIFDGKSTVVSTILDYCFMYNCYIESFFKRQAYKLRNP